MPLVHLREAISILQVEAGNPNPIVNVPADVVAYERDAVLVYTGTFHSMSGEKVTVTDEDISRLSGDRSKIYSGLLAGEKVTYADLAPLQTDHSRSSWDTIGRVMKTWVGTYEGKKALFGRLRFLGAEAVERAKDGRWTHLSVAADFQIGYLKELTVTPFPAAGGAKLLSEGEPMFEKLVVHLMAAEKLSREDAEKKVREMSEDDQKAAATKLADPGTGDPPKPLEEAPVTPPAPVETPVIEEPTPALKALMATETAAVKKFAESKGKIVELARGLRRGSKELGLDVRVAQLSERFNGLRAAGKITPAELKKIDVKHLSSASEEAQELVLKSYADRQPVVFMGEFGSSNAPDAVAAVRGNKDKGMLKEMSQDMRFSSSLVKNLLEGDEPSAEAKAGANGSQNLTDSGVPAVSAMSHFKHMSKLMEEGKHDECKAYLSKCLSDESTVAPSVDPESEKRMSGVAENFKRLQNQVDQLVQLFADAAGIEESELA